MILFDYRADWRAQTWETKRHIAKRYAGVPMSEQLRDMEARLRKAWAERGWTYPEPFLAGLPPRLETTVKNSAGGTYALLAAFCGFILLPYSWILSQ